MDLKNSHRIFKEARSVMVGGVSSPVRSFLSVGGDPLVIEKGRGSRFYDVDGNAYTDYCLSWGALILGHSHPEVVKAVQTAVKNGSSFGTTTKPEVELAKLLVKSVPSLELVRFVNSGTEATMSAIRLARGFTKKNKVVKFDGCYHGHFDDLLAKAGSGVANLPESSSQGITPNHVADTLSLPFNDISICEKILTQCHNEIACCIIEPIAGNMGVIPAQREFLEGLRRITQKYKIVLIFDEIITGFRTGFGGTQDQLGITPDLTCLGKIIGGGFPVGSYGGRKDIMNHLAPLGGVYQAGTFAGNPVVMSAGLAVLKNLDNSFYKNLNQISENFATDMNTFFIQKNIPARITHYKSMLSLRFDIKPIRNYTDALAASSKKKYRELFHYLLQHKIYWPPADLETFFISGAHTSKDLLKLSKILKMFFGKGRL